MPIIILFNNVKIKQKIYILINLLIIPQYIFSMEQIPNSWEVLVNFEKESYIINVANSVPELTIGQIKEKLLKQSENKNLLITWKLKNECTIRVNIETDESAYIFTDLFDRTITVNEGKCIDKEYIVKEFNLPDRELEDQIIITKEVSKYIIITIDHETTCTIL